MYAAYTLTKDELNQDFIDRLKNMITGNQVYLTIENYDETEYLMNSPKNKEHLSKAIEYVDSGKPLIEVPIEKIIEAANEKNSI